MSIRNCRDELESLSIRYKSMSRELGLRLKRIKSRDNTITRLERRIVTIEAKLAEKPLTEGRDRVVVEKTMLDRLWPHK